MAILFGITLFLSAALLFLVQPMVAKMLLPALGGTPNVWITCMLFFQAGLLVGYAYAHAGCRWLGVRVHGCLHLTLLLAAFAFLPIDLTTTSAEGDPTSWLLGSLLLGVGLPYVMVSSSAPLLQKWFAVQSGSRDPYFLYAASNLGSFAGLLSYPFLVEPALRLHEQSSLWMWGYVVLALLVVVCGVPLMRLSRSADDSTAQVEQTSDPPTALTRLRWVLLALVPSSLMLSVTMHLTTDIAAVPLLWIVPIAIYLLSFVLVFARWSLIPHCLMLRSMPAAVIVLVFVLLSEATEPPELLIAIHVIGLFWLCMTCHGELARTRPAAVYLTEFYLWLAVGGALGGLFNAVVSPLLFNSVAEYPLMLVAACCLRPAAVNAVRWNDLLLPVGLGLLTVGLILVGQGLSLEPGPISLAAMFALPCLVAYTLLDRPIRFGLGVAAILMAANVYEGVHGRPEQRVRSFFGVHRVTQDRAGEFRLLIHGNTVHGQQKILGPPDERRRPLTYYHERSPIGQLLTAYRGDEKLKRVALVGLGAGALASYAEPGQKWTFFEIDPAVEKLARSHFTYLSESRGEIDVVIGDARVMLQKQPDRAFGLIVIDAFSSDAIPVHLLTREALTLYRRKLTKDGLLAFHISNRYLDLQPVLTALARDAKPPMTALYQEGYVTPDDKAQGCLPSQWMVLAGKRDDVSKLLASRRWEEPLRQTAVWTDDYSNVLSVLRARTAGD